jgi:hypothetical protein
MKRVAGEQGSLPASKSTSTPLLTIRRIWKLEGAGGKSLFSLSPFLPCSLSFSNFTKLKRTYHV